MWLTEMTSKLIIHIEDNATAMCPAVINNSRDMDEAARHLEATWITVNGAPSGMALHPQIDNGDFKAVLKRYAIEPRPKPARKQEKIGSVESAYDTLRKRTLRVLMDAEYERDTNGTSFTSQEILSHAVLSCCLLHDQKTLSSFEFSRGYIPRIAGNPQSPADVEFIEAHLEQIARRALTKIIHSRIPQNLSLALLTPKTPFYFFEKRGKNVIWEAGFVHGAGEHIVELTRNEFERGKLQRIAYEGIRLYPSTSLLQELDAIEQAGEKETDANPTVEDAVHDGHTPVKSSYILIQTGLHYPDKVQYGSKNPTRETRSSLYALERQRGIGTVPLAAPRCGSLLSIRRQGSRLAEYFVNIAKSTPHEIPEKDI